MLEHTDDRTSYCHVKKMAARHRTNRFSEPSVSETHHLIKILAAYHTNENVPTYFNKGCIHLPIFSQNYLPLINYSSHPSSARSIATQKKTKTRCIFCPVLGNNNHSETLLSSGQNVQHTRSTTWTYLNVQNIQIENKITWPNQNNSVALLL